MSITDDNKQDSRRGTYSLDKHYIELYIAEPWISHVDLYQKACKLAGVKVQKVPRQAAYELHNRVIDTIQSELIRLSTDDKALGRAVLRSLAKDAKTESVRASTAMTLAKGLYPDITIHKDMTAEEIQAEIDTIDNQLDALH